MKKFIVFICILIVICLSSLQIFALTITDFSITNYRVRVFSYYGQSFDDYSTTSLIIRRDETTGFTSIKQGSPLDIGESVFVGNIYFENYETEVVSTFHYASSFSAEMSFGIVVDIGTEWSSQTITNLDSSILSGDVFVRWYYNYGDSYVQLTCPKSNVDLEIIDSNTVCLSGVMRGTFSGNKSYTITGVRFVLPLYLVMEHYDFPTSIVTQATFSSIQSGDGSMPAILPSIDMSSPDGLVERYKQGYKSLSDFTSTFTASFISQFSVPFGQISDFISYALRNPYFYALGVVSLGLGTSAFILQGISLFTHNRKD